MGDTPLQLRVSPLGPFAPADEGRGYPAREIVEKDLAAMAACGVNALRVYTPPPAWFLDLARQHDLYVLVGLAWTQHIAFLESRREMRRIVHAAQAQAAAIAGDPQVLAVAVGNEIPAAIARWHGSRNIESFIEQLASVVRSEDPEALVTYVNYPSTEYRDLPFLDVVSFNVFLESNERFEDYVARLHNLAGDRPLLITEIGLDGRRHGHREQALLVELQTRTAFAGGCAGAFVFSWTDERYRGGAGNGLGVSG